MPVDLAAARRLARIEQHRAAAATWFEDQETEFEAAVAAALRAVFRPVLEQWGLTADGESIDDLAIIRSEWAAEVEHTLLPRVALMYETGALSALLALRESASLRVADTRLDLLDDVLDRQALSFLEAAHNRLVGVGNRAWSIARDELATGFAAGEPIRDLAARIEHALAVSEERAVTIARTEVVSASNAGSLAGASALGPYGPERKQWLATIDSRTRDSHMAADGQVVAMTEQFDVGGALLEYPGDPSGPAREVVNCRCTVIYLEPGDDDGSLIDSPGRGQGGPDGGAPPLSDRDLAAIAADASQETDMSRPRAIRTRHGMTVVPPPPRRVHAVVEEEPGATVPPPPPDEEPAAPVDDEAVDAAVDEAEATLEDLVLTIPADVLLRPFEAVLAVEGRWTGDDRYVLPGAIRWDGLLPMPLTVDHEGTVDSVVGFVGELARVTNPANTAENLIIARGFFDLGRVDRPNEAAVRTVDRIESLALSGVSMETDDITVGGVDPSTLEPGDDPWWMQVTEDCRVRALSVVPTGAFAECRITLDPEGVTIDRLPPAPDGPRAVTSEEAQAIEEAQEEAIEELLDDLPGEVVVVASGDGFRLVETRPRNAPPADWFVDPQLEGPTPLTITDDGRVYGHIATWGTCHVGLAGQCITPPRSGTDYAHFRTGEVVCADGSRVATGTLTIGTGHASTQLDARAAAFHYDNTGTGWSDVAAGEDRWGVWVAGAVKASATPEQIADARAAAPSGDWRRIGSSMELVAVLQVNVPGFPVPRARTASGVPQALVAAGGPVRARRHNPALEAAAERIAASIGRDRASRAAALSARVHGS